LQRAANTEALGMMARALQILGSLPDTPERARQELDLQLVSGGAHWLIKGFGSPDTEQTFRRARALAESLGDGVRLALALRGLAICYFMRGEHGRARAETERLIALSQGAAGAADLMWARMMIGCILFQQGEFIAARAELEAALAMHDPIEQSAKTVSSQLDPGIWARATLAWDLWVLGFPDQALAASAQTMATARAIGQPSSMAVALTYDAIVKLSRRDLDAAGVSAAELRTVATEHHMIYHIAVASLLEGAILVERGACAAGLRLLQQGLAEFRAQQAGSFVPWALAWAAAGCLGDRMTDAALAYLTEGFAAVDAHGERQWEAELRRLKAELLASSPADAGAAESCLREAIQQAGAQGARSPQLRAAAALARMLRARGQLEAARAVLGKAYGQFTEGFATADLRDAKALLDELAPPGRRAGAGSPRRASRATSLPR
jgi:tetratricopeptide (TPR) repeat protein